MCSYERDQKKAIKVCLEHSTDRHVEPQRGEPLMIMSELIWEIKTLYFMRTCFLGRFGFCKCSLHKGKKELRSQEKWNSVN